MNTLPNKPQPSPEELASAKRVRDLFCLMLLRDQIPFIQKRTDRPVLSPATWDGNPAHICLSLDRTFGAVFSQSGELLGMAYYE